MKKMVDNCFCVERPATALPEKVAGPPRGSKIREIDIFIGSLVNPQIGETRYLRGAKIN